MNELVTPPGYVEYPRDPKFRPMDEIDRLELMARGYSYFRVVCFRATPFACCGTIIHRFNWWYFGFELLLNVLIVSAMRAGLSRIYRAKGWNESLALFFPLLVGGIGLIHTTMVLPYLDTYIAYLAALIAALVPAAAAVRRQFKAFGVPFGNCSDGAKLRALVAELRAEQGDVEPALLS